MKFGILTTTGVLIAIAFASPASAENAAQVKQLLETKNCRGCDLTGSQLSGMDLSGSDLTAISKMAGSMFLPSQA
ncbi:MAG: pentapeptide repeat-containing protein [Oscillatoriales cyanobacterium RU_3_3]|nr:pentapeptide repeat-containing protein [Oscillatoriales cyanobacterium RU_3_3]